jgi:voltage-dependent calcium channel T type alpha-1G
MSKNAKKMGGNIKRVNTLMKEFLELEGKSLNIFDETNKFRILLYKIVTHRFFDYIIISVIVMSAIQLALDSPIGDPESSLKKSLFWVDLTTTIVFLIEMVTKILTFGLLFNGKHSYLRSRWNIMDMAIVVFSILSLTPLSDSLRTFKIFRVLRLLRLISRNENLKVAMRALMRAIPNILNITVIMLLFFLIFGVIGVSYFKGKLYYCTEPMDDLSDVVESKWDCLSSGGEWMNYYFTFDNAA